MIDKNIFVPSTYDLDFDDKDEEAQFSGERLSGEQAEIFLMISKIFDPSERLPGGGRRKKEGGIRKEEGEERKEEKERKEEGRGKIEKEGGKRVEGKGGREEENMKEEGGMMKWIGREGGRYLREGKEEIMMAGEGSKLGFGLEMARMGKREELIYEVLRKSKSKN